MIIAVDTRERAAYEFKRFQRVTLSEGDYSIVGMEHLVSIERKSRIDMLGSLGKNRARFEREVQRLAKLDYAAIVIECSLLEFLQPHPRSQMSPKAAINSLLAWSVRYRLPIFFAHDRFYGRAVTYQLLAKFYKETQKQKQKQENEKQVQQAQETQREKPITEAAAQCPTKPRSGRHTRHGSSKKQPIEDLISSDNISRKRGQAAMDG